MVTGPANTASNETPTLKFSSWLERVDHFPWSPKSLCTWLCHCNWYERVACKAVQSKSTYFIVPTGSLSRGGDVAVYVFNVFCLLCLRHKPTELAHSFFYSVLVSVSVFMALSTIFHSINSPDNSPLSHSVLPVLFLPHWSFQLYVSLWKSPSALI